MRLLELKIDNFKNLKNFEIDFDEKYPHTVLLGENATGKSNLLEAIILIFKYLDLEKPNEIPFNYYLKYKKKNYFIELENDNKTTIKIDGSKISFTEFKKLKNEYLPNMYLLTILEQVIDLKSFLMTIKKDFMTS